MNNLCCPTCKVELMKHEAWRCLDAWVAALVGWSDIQANAFVPFGRDWCGTTPDKIGGFYDTGRAAFPYFSRDLTPAWELMGKVWEMDARAAILKETIFIQVAGNKAPQHIPIDGSTFPLRVCRAFLFLKAKESAT